VSSSEDRTRLARIFNMSDVAVQTVKMASISVYAFADNCSNSYNSIWRWIFTSFWKNDYPLV